MDIQSSEHNEQTMTEAPKTLTGDAKPWNTICPVMDDAINPAVETVIYNGRVYGFCCPASVQPFKENSEKYAARLSADGKIILPGK
jgi:YHS domain-containing protein